MKFKECKRNNSAKQAGYDANDFVFEDEKGKRVYTIPGDVSEELLETKSDITPLDITNIMKKRFNTNPDISPSGDTVTYTKAISASRPTRSFLIELIHDELRLLATTDKSMGDDIKSDKSFENLDRPALEKILSVLKERRISQMIDANPKRLQEESEQANTQNYIQ